MLTRELMVKLLAGEYSEKELETSKVSFIETLPRTFETKWRTVLRFAGDELVGRDRAYWPTYRQRIGAVTAKATREAATRHIRRISSSS